LSNTRTITKERERAREQGWREGKKESEREGEKWSAGGGRERKIMRRGEIDIVEDTGREDSGGDSKAE
jgi:hypothetical protein